MAWPNTYRERSWLCHRCGAMHDAASPMPDHTKPRSPRPGDLSICVACGAAHVRREASWALMPAAEVAALPRAARALLTRAQIERARFAGAFKTDTRGGHA